MRALVTGGGGFIGSAVARGLLERGDDVAVIDNFITGSEAMVPDGARLHRVDLRDLDAVRAACEGAEVVFHQAAVRSVPRSVDDPQLTQTCNINGTLNLLMAARDAGARRVVYASSASVYGDTHGEVAREDMIPSPRSPYAVTKLTGEYYGSVWNDLLGLSTISLRYFNVFGPGQHPESLYAAVFPAFISALAAGEPPQIHWDGEQTRDFSFIDDVVRANLLAGDAPEAAGGAIVNIAGGRPKSINDVFETVSRVLGTSIEPERVPKRPWDVRNSQGDVAKAAEVLGWKPESDWDDSVAATVAWFTSGAAVLRA